MERQILGSQLKRHLRELSQHARLREFAFSESGEMLAEKAAQMGAVLAASALAGLLMSAGTAHAASCPTLCFEPMDCGAGGPWFCVSQTCELNGIPVCTSVCSLANSPNC